MQRNDPLLRPGNGTRSMGRIPPIEPHFRRGWFPAEKEGPSRETRTFFLFRPAPSEPGQLFAGHFHLDAPERVAPYFIRIVTENDAFGRDEEILRRGDVFGAEPGGNEPFVVPNVVLFVEFPADQPAEALQLRFGEEIGQGDFVASVERVDVVLAAVHAVRTAGVTRLRDGVDDQGVHDGAFGFGGDFVFRIAGACRQTVGEVDVGELADGCGCGLPHRAGEGFQIEEIADVRLLDRREGGGFPGVEDRRESVFDFAGDSVAADERVGGRDAETGLYGAFRAGTGGKERGGEKQGDAGFHG